MKKRKHIKTFEDKASEFNIDSSTDDNIFDIDKYDTILTIDVSNHIDILLEDLQSYCEDNNITLDDIAIGKIISIFKEKLDFRNKAYYTETDHYESLTNDSSDKFFEDIIDKAKDRLPVGFYHF